MAEMPSDHLTVSVCQIIYIFVRLQVIDAQFLLLS